MDPIVPTLLLSALLTALASAVPPPPDVPAALTFEDAVRIARDRNPDMALAEAALAIARSQARAAGQLPNPAASFMAGWSSQCGDPGCREPVFAAGLGDQGAVAALVTGQRGLALDAGAQSVRSAEAARQDARRTLEFEVKRQFVATSVAWQGVDFAQREVAHAREAVLRARRRRDAGEIPAGDIARLEVLLLQVEQGLERGMLVHEQARLALAQLLGMHDGAPAFTVVTGPTGSADPPARLAAATLPDLLALARERRPDLAAARASLEAARSAAELARRRLIPAFQLQAQYTQQGAPGAWFTPPTTSFGISLPLPVLYQQQGEIGVADAGVAAAEATVAKVEGQIAVDVATSLAAFQATRRSARRAEERLLVLTRESRETVGLAYAQGTASLLDYLDTQRTRLANEVEYLRILQAFWTSVFEVERAVGTSFVP
ncbi:MAG: TolC family protein [Anaeromyxobacteraceae bacterium]